MSVITSKIYNDRIVMAADSILVSGWSKRSTNDFAKINQDNGMIIGGCGIAEEISMMWHFMSTHKPSAASEGGVLNFIIEFSKWKKDLTGNSGVNNAYLLAYEGHLFEIENMLVIEIKDYRAIGAGEDFSNAALYLGHTPKEAVKVACDLCCFVSEPIVEFTMCR